MLPCVSIRCLDLPCGRATHFKSFIDLFCIQTAVSIRVLRAHYGAHAQVADVTFAVQQIVDSHGAGTRGDVRFRVENHVLRGDPAPGVAKTLFVSYSVNGAPERTFIAGEGHVSASLLQSHCMLLGGPAIAVTRTHISALKFTGVHLERASRT